MEPFFWCQANSSFLPGAAAAAWSCSPEGTDGAYVTAPQWPRSDNDNAVETTGVHQHRRATLYATEGGTFTPPSICHTTKDSRQRLLLLLLLSPAFCRGWGVACACVPSPPIPCSTRRRWLLSKHTVQLEPTSPSSLTHFQYLSAYHQRTCIQN